MTMLNDFKNQSEFLDSEIKTLCRNLGIQGIYSGSFAFAPLAGSLIVPQCLILETMKLCPDNYLLTFELKGVKLKRIKPSQIKNFSRFKNSWTAAAVLHELGHAVIFLMKGLKMSENEILAWKVAERLKSQIGMKTLKFCKEKCLETYKNHSKWEEWSQEALKYGSKTIDKWLKQLLENSPETVSSLMEYRMKQANSALVSEDVEMDDEEKILEIFAQKVKKHKIKEAVKSRNIQALKDALGMGVVETSNSFGFFQPATSNGNHLHLLIEKPSYYDHDGLNRARLEWLEKGGNLVDFFNWVKS